MKSRIESCCGQDTKKNTMFEITTRLYKRTTAWCCLRSSLAEAVDSKTSTELETSRALRKTSERVKRLVKKSRNHS